MYNDTHRKVLSSYDFISASTQQKNEYSASPEILIYSLLTSSKSWYSVLQVCNLYIIYKMRWSTLHSVALTHRQKVIQIWGGLVQHDDIGKKISFGLVVYHGLLPTGIVFDPDICDLLPPNPPRPLERKLPPEPDMINHQSNISFKYFLACLFTKMIK